MKTLVVLIAFVVLLASLAQAQQSPSSQPQQIAPAVQAPACTPLEIWKHFHPETSKPLIRVFGRLSKQIEKSTGGTISGPTMDDVRKTLPPPCPVAGVPQRTVIK